jgi:hypothetical protein
MVVLYGKQAEVQRSPEAVAIELVRIAVVIRKAMVQPVTIDPAHRIDVDAEGVVDQRHALMNHSL